MTKEHAEYLLSLYPNIILSSIEMLERISVSSRGNMSVFLSHHGTTPYYYVGWETDRNIIPITRYTTRTLCEEIIRVMDETRILFV